MLNSAFVRFRYVISGTAWAMYTVLDYQRTYGDLSALTLDEHTFIAWSRIAFILNMLNTFNMVVYYTWRIFNWLDKKGVCCQRSCTDYDLTRQMQRFFSANLAFAIQLYITLFTQYFLDIVATYIRNGGSFGNTSLTGLQMILVIVVAAFHFQTFSETVIPAKKH